MGNELEYGRPGGIIKKLLEGAIEVLTYEIESKIHNMISNS